jgi:ADP-heptose:LPS heptosyltransferase
MDFNSKINLLRDFIGEILHYSFTRKNAPSAQEKHRILVIRTDRIGDFSLWSSWAAALRKEFPPSNFEITLLGNALWMPLAEKILDFDHYIPFVPGRFINDKSYRRNILNTVRSKKFNTLWQCRYYREPFLEDMICLAASPAKAVAFARGKHHLHKWAGRITDRIYQEKIELQESEIHESFKHKLFADKVAEKNIVPCDCFAALDDIQTQWSEKEYCVILPCGSKSAQCRWPSERFAAICNSLFDKNMLFAVAGTPNERETLQYTASLIGSNAEVVDNLDITSFAALIRKAKMVIGNDTGGIHIAAAAKTPSAVVCGAGTPAWFLPYPDKNPELFYPGAVLPRAVIGSCADKGCFWQCSKADCDGVHPCFADVSIESLKKEVEKCINDTKDLS